MKKISYIFLFITMFSHFSKGQDLFNPNGITLMEITFEDADWDNTLQGYFLAGNNDRLLATIEINGVNFDSVGVRYRGGGTFDSSYGKNPFNIKLDHIKNQDYNGTETLKLNNGDKDPSFVREVLSYEIAGQFMEAPKANYAKVFVNGAYHGLYVNVETVDKTFMKDHFYSDKNNPFFNCNPASTDNPPTIPPIGCALSNFSSLEYLGESLVCYFDYYEIESDEGWTDLKDLTKTLVQNPNNIETVLDIDRTIWWSAFNNVMVNLDSYLGAFTKNYYLFQDDNDRFNPLVWDLNESFGGSQLLDAAGSVLSLNDMQQLNPMLRTADATRPLLELILGDPTYRRQYVAHYRTIFNDIIGGGWYATRAQELINLISADVIADSNKIYTETEFTANLNSTVSINSGGVMLDVPGVSELMNARATYLQGHTELIKTPPTISDLNTTPANVTPSSDVIITATITGGEAVYIGYRSNLTEIFQKTNMFDDGMHGDGTAGDGIYGVELNVGVEGIQYYIYAESVTNDVGMFSPAKAEFEFHTLVPSGDLVINEFQASNSTTQADQDGEYDDWVEIYNNTSSSINLEGYYLSDNLTNLVKFQFPNVSIDGNSFLIIWLDGDPGQQGLHADFKLSASGERLILSDPNQQVLDQIIFAAQITDRTTGRYPNGTGPFVDMPATFNAPNSIETSTYDLANELGMKLFPNPTNDFLVIEFENKDFSESMDLDLVNILGQKIKTIQVDKKVTMDVSDLNTGIYFLTFENRLLGKVVISD